MWGAKLPVHICVLSSVDLRVLWEQKAEVIQQLVWFKSGPPRLELTEEGPFLCLYLDGIMQSKMNQLAPAATLSAHLEPVLYSLQRLKPDAVLQLGLGGGDINRFMTTVLPNTHLLTIELSHEVIDAYQRFFCLKGKEQLLSLSCTRFSAVESAAMAFCVLGYLPALCRLAAGHAKPTAAKRYHLDQFISA